ncbi:MAG: hypothetical protein RLZZ399_1416 [Verrucomicrobiota bacterium]|jgi:hypothetical protein
MENLLPLEPESAPTPSTPDVPSSAAEAELPPAPLSPTADSAAESEAAPSDEQPAAETEVPSEASSPEASSLESSAELTAPAPEPGSLEDFAARSQKSRLPADQEAQASELLRSILLGGRAEVARAVSVIPTLPWIVTVQGTAAAWPEMKPSFRSQLLAGLARAQGENAPRVRLSLARGLFKVDAAAAMKLILLTLKVLRDKQTGLLSGKGAPLFANVLIGRGKAWALQLPTADLKPAEIDLLVHSALHGAFYAPQAPISQLSILRWAASLGRLANLPEALDQMAAKSISRWSAKWQAALKKEVESLPPSWLELFKPFNAQEETPRARPNNPEDSDSQRREEETEEASPIPTAAPGDHAEPEPDSSEKEEDHDEDLEEEEDEEDLEETKSRHAGRERQERPVYVSKTLPQNGNMGRDQGRRSGAPAPFNLQESLRQIEQYAQGLRSELQAAQRQLKLREDDSRRRKFDRQTGPIIPGEPSPEELARLNLQLESRNNELAAQIAELTLDAEDRAASLGLTTDSPAPTPDAQLRTLLAFKLKDDFEDFKALEEAAKDLVVQQHYRSVLQHVFEVLRAEGIEFTLPESPA